jgi:hypothetical protein
LLHQPPSPTLVFEGECSLPSVTHIEKKRTRPFAEGGCCLHHPPSKRAYALVSRVAILCHHLPRDRAYALVFEGGCCLLHPPPPPTLKKSVTLPNERVRSFSRVTVFLPPPLSLQNERTCSFWKEVVVYYHFHILPRKWVYALVFEGA